MLGNAVFNIVNRRFGRLSEVVAGSVWWTESATPRFASVKKNIFFFCTTDESYTLST